MTTDAAGPGDEAVVDAAVDAAEAVVFSRYDRSDLRDLDITVTFEDGNLEVDVYINPEDEDGAGNRSDPERVADDAALAARGAVDDLFD